MSGLHGEQPCRGSPRWGPRAFHPVPRALSAGYLPAKPLCSWLSGLLCGGCRPRGTTRDLCL